MQTFLRLPTQLPCGSASNATSSNTVGKKSWPSGFWKTSPTMVRMAVKLSYEEAMAETQKWLEEMDA